jgi:hypothetical protein
MIYSEVPAIQGCIAIFQAPERLKNVAQQKPRFLLFAAEEFMDELFSVSITYKRLYESFKFL